MGVVIMLPADCSFVVASISILFFKSTSKPKLARKSAPIMAWLTSATRKFQVNRLRSPRSVARYRLAKVLIGVPFAACSRNGVGVDIFSFRVAGTIDTSDPVSTRNRSPLVLSERRRRRLENAAPTSADAGGLSSSFLTR
uniref:(northern house mosquito) hypothetical protein n=1 Tax=Culex pipiens TaxID=7175 RepID=A0A8D8G7M1_CULPI